MLEYQKTVNDYQADLALTCTFCVFVRLELHDFKVIEVGLLLGVEHFKRKGLIAFTNFQEVALELAHSFFNINCQSPFILIPF